MNLLDPLRQAKCLHDTSRSFRREVKEGHTHTTVFCDDCNSLLFSKTSDADTGGGVVVSFSDGLYETLYTRKGRTRLLTAIFESEGISVPKSWAWAAEEEES